MADDRFSGLRPAWLVGGGALLAVLGLCAVFSLCAAVGLIWFYVQTSSDAARATPVAILPPSVSPALATVTPLPGLGEPPVSTPFSPAPSSTPLRLPPEQAVRDYYQLVSQKRYDLTWPLLDEAFKQKFNCCAPAYNYSGYISWWNSVNHVELGTVQTVSQSGDQAVIYAELVYVMNSGARSSVDSDPYIVLIYDPTTGAWRFDDKRATP